MRIWWKQQRQLFNYSNTFQENVSICTYVRTCTYISSIYIYTIWTYKRTHYTDDPMYSRLCVFFSLLFAPLCIFLLYMSIDSEFEFACAFDARLSYSLSSKANRNQRKTDQISELYTCDSFLSCAMRVARTHQPYTPYRRRPITNVLLMLPLQRSACLCILTAHSLQTFALHT